LNKKNLYSNKLNQYANGGFFMALHDENHEGLHDDRYVECAQARHYPFVPVPLPYAYEALEPKIDALTMHLHHDRHYTTYVNNLNAALKDYPQFHEWTLEQLIVHGNQLPPAIQTAVARNAGGVFNHEFYFAGLNPSHAHAPNSPVGMHMMHPPLTDALKNELKKNALAVFGSGYAWLCQNSHGEICVITTANQDTPLTLGLQPLLCIDVWEHAYYLKHYNDRGSYFDDWFSLVE